MSSETKLTRDEDEESVDDTKYRGMIGSLIYLMASRPDIVFSVCLCARFQEDSKSSHLEAAHTRTLYFSFIFMMPALCRPPVPFNIEGQFHSTNGTDRTGWSPGILPSQLLNTPKSTHSPLTSPPPAPSQPSKQSSPLAINLDPVELIFSTPPTSPHLFFNSLEDLPPRTTNLPPPRPSFDTIERLDNQPSPLPAMEPPLPPLPPQLPPLGPKNPFILFTHEMFCDHCQRTQVIVNDLREETRFILNHILQRLDLLSHKNHP
ncbi:hypothetical protein Tco_0261714 [Tanacetum coccineum]